VDVSIENHKQPLLSALLIEQWSLSSPHRVDVSIENHKQPLLSALLIATEVTLLSSQSGWFHSSLLSKYIQWSHCSPHRVDSSIENHKQPVQLIS
jgi:hypothetical protein